MTFPQNPESRVSATSGLDSRFRGNDSKFERSSNSFHNSGYSFSHHQLQASARLPEFGRQQLEHGPNRGSNKIRLQGHESEMAPEWMLGPTDQLDAGFHTPNLHIRFGFSYKLTEKMVVRGGYGIFYGFLGQRRFPVIQSGFTASTPLNVSLNNGLNFLETLSNNIFLRMQLATISWTSPLDPEFLSLRQTQ